jgi:Protein of unknown function (DUF2924)
MNDMLKNLKAMTSEALKKEWEQCIGLPPPKSTSRDHFIRVIAWHRQAKDQGGLAGALKRRLRQLAEDLESGKAQRLLNPPPKVKPGTMIIKTWQGVEHRVMALEDGFAFEGKTWKSLSMIAREITGTRWNGPAFFGLRKAIS